MNLFYLMYNFHLQLQDEVLKIQDYFSLIRLSVQHFFCLDLHYIQFHIMKLHITTIIVLLYFFYDK